MRIAIFTNNYLPNPFGVAGSIESFRKEFERHGHTVYIFAPEFKGYVDENPNACPPERRVFRYPSFDLTFKNIHFPIAIPYSYKMSRILDKLEIDIVHSQHPNLLGWTAKHWAKKKNVPLVFTWHTLYDKYAHFAPLIPEKIAAWWTIGNAVSYANSADQIIVPTKSVKKIIRDWGVKNNNIEAIATGVEEKLFQDSKREETRAEMGITDNEIALLLVSRLTPEKNVEFLVCAVANVLKKTDNTKFIVAGVGSELNNLKEVISKNGLEKRVIFLGVVANDVKKNIYAAGDIFVYASTSETQGMILTEAMCSGLPIVAVNATGAKDIVGNYVTGILTKENENAFAVAVTRLIKDGIMRKKMGETAKLVAHEHYTDVVSAQKMLAVYEKAILKKSEERKG